MSSPMTPLGQGFYWASGRFVQRGLHFSRWKFRLWLLPLSLLQWWRYRKSQRALDAYRGKEGGTDA